MAVPSSGELKLYADIQNEAGGAQANTSLHNLSIYAGFSTPDAMSDFYGWADIELGAVTTNNTTSVGSSSMTLNGNLTSTGFDTSVQVGFYFGTSTNRTSNSKIQQGTRSTTGTFALGRSGLTYGTNYYAWSYAITDAGEVQGARKDATTTYPPFTPTTKNTQCFGQCFYVSSTGPTPLSKWETGYINPYSGISTSIVSLNCSGNSCFRQMCFVGGKCETAQATNAKTYYCTYVDSGPVGCYSSIGTWASWNDSVNNCCGDSNYWCIDHPTSAVTLNGNRASSANCQFCLANCFYIGLWAPGGGQYNPVGPMELGWKGTYCLCQ